MVDQKKIETYEVRKLTTSPFFFLMVVSIEYDIVSLIDVSV